MSHINQICLQITLIGAELFNIFVDSMDPLVTPSCGVVSTLEGRDAIQSVLDKLER